MHPQRIKVSAIRPCKRTQLDTDLLKQLNVFECCENTRIGAIHQRRHIDDAARTVVAGDREPIADSPAARWLRARAKARRVSLQRGNNFDSLHVMYASLIVRTDCVSSARLQRPAHVAYPRWRVSRIRPPRLPPGSGCRNRSIGISVRGLVLARWCPA